MTEQETRRLRRARFEGLAQVVTAPLHRYLLRRTAPGMVEDVLSETMLVLWRRIDHVPGLRDGSLPDGDDVLPWCYRVARGCLANVPQVAVPVVTDHSDLHAALAALGELDREVIRLWAWEELAPRQIAEATGMTANAVSVRLHRAKKKIAEQLQSGRKKAELAGHKMSEGRSGQ
nr:sigma-70 family RNA polymerase sigma factor [Streptomyces xylophagus]